MTERNASILSQSVILSGASRRCCFPPEPDPSAVEGPAHFHREMTATDLSRFRQSRPAGLSHRHLAAQFTARVHATQVLRLRLGGAPRIDTPPARLRSG